MSSVKRKAPSAAAASRLAAAALEPSSSKRARFAPSTDEGEANADGDLDLEEQDRKRNQQGRKGRVITEGYESESSDDDDQDGGTHRRNAERNIKAGAQDDDEDMFDVQDDQGPADAGEESAKKSKRFLKLGEIEGQEFSSRTRRHGSAEADSVQASDEDLDPDLELESSGEEQDDDDDDLDLNARGERTPPTSPGGTPIRPEKGRRKGKAAGKKSKGVKITGFNMKEEMKTGKFDENGNFIENEQDPHAQHDVWLAGNYSRRKIKAAREAQQKAEKERREKEALAEQEDNDEDELRKELLEFMRRSESVLGTLQRLGQESKKLGKEKKGHRKKQEDVAPKDAERPKTKEKSQVVKDLERVTHLSSVLMSKFGHMGIYEETYETLLETVRKSGLVRATFDPAARFDSPSASTMQGGQDPTSWEYRWTPSYLAAAARASGTPVSPDVETFGPYTESDLRSWAQGGYFGEGGERILLRPAGTTEAWKPYSDCFGDA